MVNGFIEPSYLIVAIIGVLVFSIFNFRPKGKAKCFAGDVGSIGIAFIILFALGKLMLATQDVTYIIFFLVYGIDGSMTIFHRIMLHENLGQVPGMNRSNASEKIDPFPGRLSFSLHFCNCRHTRELYWCR